MDIILTIAATVVAVGAAILVIVNVINGCLQIRKSWRERNP